ncbi:hypothetical protein P9112_000089 [Eukaryota sp. TZLM1-RC]
MQCTRFHFSKAGKSIHAQLHRPKPKHPSSRDIVKKTTQPNNSTLVSEHFANRSIDRSSSTLVPPPQPIRPQTSRISRPRPTSSFASSPRPSTARPTVAPPVGHYHPKDRLTSPTSPRFALKPRRPSADPVFKACPFAHNVSSCDTSLAPQRSPSPSSSFLSSPRKNPSLSQFDGWIDHSLDPVSPRSPRVVPFDKQMARPSCVTSPSAPDVVYKTEEWYKQTRRNHDPAVPLSRQSKSRDNDAMVSVPDSYPVNYSQTDPRLIVPKLELYSPRSHHQSNLIEAEYDVDESLTRPSSRTTNLRRYSPRRSFFDSISDKKIDVPLYNPDKSRNAVSPKKDRFITFDKQSPRHYPSDQSKNQSKVDYYDYDVVSPRTKSVLIRSNSRRFVNGSFASMSDPYEANYNLVSPRTRGPSISKQLSRDVGHKSTINDLYYDIPPSSPKNTFIKLDAQICRKRAQKGRSKSSAPDVFYDPKFEVTSPRVCTPKLAVK